MSRLTDVAIKLFGPRAVISVLESQDPEGIGKECAELVDKALDAEFGNKKSEQVQKVLVPFIDRFIKAFNGTLLEDQK